MTKVSDNTRADLIDAATNVFAAKGFDAGSVRDITRRAKTNAAAVSYHFGGKDGLYREVLRGSLTAFDVPSFDPAAVDGMPRDDAVRAYFVAQLSAMRRHDEVARYLRIFAWETVSRSPVFVDFLATETLPVVDSARAIVARYVDSDDPEAREVALLWFLHQVEPFIRDPCVLTDAPFRLRIDAAFVARLAERLSAAVIAGLNAFARPALQSPVAGAA